MKRIFHSFLVLIIATAMVLTAFPAEIVSAKPNHDKKDNWWDWSDYFDDWDDWADTDEKPTDYLVLVGESNGSYTAYEDIAFITGGSYVMVKAKPLATALGLKYKTTSTNKKKKGMSLSLGQDKNVYIKNSKTYYFYDYNSTTNQTNATGYKADYKQIEYSNQNAVHAATLRTLVNYQYYDTTGIINYAGLGYCGVVVYNKYSGINKLPDITTISNFDFYNPNNNSNNNNNGNNTNNGNNNNNSNNNALNITIKPFILTDPTYSDIKNVDATYSISQTNSTQNLDLTEVLNTYKAYNLPYTGIYGSGNCDTAVTLQAYDKNGCFVGDLKNNGSEFLINFPTATKLVVTGNVKNLILDFTPVFPTLITNTTKYAFNQINWVYQSDGYARQYYILADYIKLYPENVSSSSAIFRKFLSTGTYTNPDYAASYQRVTVVFKSPSTELTSPYCYLNFQRTNNGINNSLVVFSDPGTTTLAADYETKLLSMINTLNKTGSNTYFPSKNWNKQLIIKLPDNTVNTAYTYITVEASSLNLDYFYDYYLTLHEMVHYYEASQPHYGFRFEAWKDGNATTLAKKTMDALGVSYKDAQGNDILDALLATNYSFLTQDNKNNFEAYYLNASGWNATLTGYHFTKFLQDVYGSDIINRIMAKVYAANISTTVGRNSTYDKQFTDCIKSVTSQDVFQLFVKYSVN